ncbi:MAG: carboxypeptidase-like regulatory domain-containing protein [Bacteroidia bacterium]|nr:carboxypeptidase-like regulatory domain-containing protein [Bacteroidia bacterium]
MIALQRFNTIRNNVLLKKLSFILLFIISQAGFSQVITQTVRGTVADKISKSPLIGASVVIKGSNPVKGSGTDADGKFKIEKVAVGRVSLKIT